MPPIQPEQDDHEAELTGLREQVGHLDRGPRGQTESASERNEQQRREQQDRCEQHTVEHDLGGLDLRGDRPEEHTKRDEEHREEEVGERSELPAHQAADRES